jgi:hypothetical protein
MRQNLALAYGLKGNEARARELNLRDVTPEQTEENVRFYKHYAQLKKEHKKMDLAEQLDSAFSEPTEPVKIIGAEENSASDEAVDMAPSAGKATKKAKAEKTAKEDVKKAELQDEAKNNDEKPVGSEKKEESFFGKDVVYSFPSAPRH